MYTSHTVHTSTRVSLVCCIRPSAPPGSGEGGCSWTSRMTFRVTPHPCSTTDQEGGGGFRGGGQGTCAGQFSSLSTDWILVYPPTFTCTGPPSRARAHPYMPPIRPSIHLLKSPLLYITRPPPVYYNQSINQFYFANEGIETVTWVTSANYMS